MLDSWDEWLVVAPAILIALGMTLAFLRKGGHIKTPIVEAGEESPPETEYGELLKGLAQDIRVLYEAFLPMLTALGAVLEAEKGQVNGNVDEAIEIVAKAKENIMGHLMSRVGSGCD